MFEQIAAIFGTVDFYQAMIRMTTPILLAAIGGLLAERAGIVTFGMESMVLMGTVGAVIGSSLTHSPWGGLLGAMMAGMFIAFIFALIAVSIGANQIVAAVALNLGALGLSDVTYALAFAGPEGVVQDVIRVPSLPVWKIPLLGDIPFLGEVFFDHLPLVYLAFVAVPVVWFILYRTTWGLKIRSVGEHPHAADVLGISVVKMRYLTILCAGAMAGLAGAFLSIGLLSSYSANMTGGRGFIAYTAIIFGNWEPVGVLLGSLLFGAADALQLRIQGLGFNIPSQFLVAFPYLVTLVALVLLVGKAGGPAAYGSPWRREER